MIRRVKEFGITLGPSFFIFTGSVLISCGTNWKIGSGIFLIALPFYRVFLVISRNILKLL